jgi:hypothetical protein
MLQDIVGKFKDLFTFYLKIINLFSSIIHFIAKVRYPSVYNVYISLNNEYICILSGHIKSSHIHLFIALGLLVGSEDYFYYLFIMVLSSRVKTSMYIRALYILSPKMYRTVNYLLNIIYTLCLALCMGHIVNFFILPLIKKLVIFIKTVFNGILHMSGSNEGNLGTGGSNMNNHTPEPQKPTPDFDKKTHIGSSKKKSKKKNKSKEIHPFFGVIKKEKDRDPLDETNIFRENYDNFFGAIARIYVEEAKQSFNLPKIVEEYRDYLPSQDKQSLNDLLNKKMKKPWGSETTVKEF